MKRVRLGRSVFAMITMFTVITMFSANELFTSLNMLFTAYAEGAEQTNEEAGDAEPGDNDGSPGEGYKDNDIPDEAGVSGDGIDEPGDNDGDDVEDGIDGLGDNGDDVEDGIDGLGDNDGDEDDGDIDIDRPGSDADNDVIEKPGDDGLAENNEKGKDGNIGGIPLDPKDNEPNQPDGGLQQHDDREVLIEWPHLDGYKGQLLDFLMQEGVISTDVYDTVVDFFVNVMWEVTAENLYSLIINQRISADDAVEHILLLYDVSTWSTPPITTYSKANIGIDMPDELIGAFIKDVTPDEDNFRRYEISLSFEVNPRTLKEEGTVADLAGQKFKVSGKNKTLKDMGFDAAFGESKINGVEIDSNTDYFIQITNPDGSIGYEKIEPNLVYIAPGDPEHDSACTLWHPKDFPDRRLNVWIPGFNGQQFNLSENKSFDDYVIFTSLPYSTTYNTIADVVITDTLPDNFHYVKGSVKAMGEDGNTLPITEIQEREDGSIEIRIPGQCSANRSPYTITYEIQANDWILEDGGTLMIGEATMDYNIVDVGPAKQAASNTAWLDVPPLIKLGLGMFDICYIDTEYVIDYTNVSSALIEYTPPSLAGYDIPTSWKACYDEAAVKNGIKDKASSLITDGISGMRIGKGLNEDSLSKDCKESTDNYAVLANEYKMIYGCDVTIRILGVEGTLAYSLTGIDGGLHFKPVNNGLFDILTICGDIQFQVGLHPGEKRVFKLRKDVNEEDFSATTYVPYGYSQSTDSTGSINLADAIAKAGTYNTIVAIFKNGNADAIAALADAIEESLSIKVNVAVTKPNSPWFRDWAWKRQDRNEFESEVRSP